MEKILLKPQTRAMGNGDIKQVTAENEAMIEVRRVLNENNIHRVSRTIKDGYTHALKSDNGEYLLYFSAQTKEGGNKRKKEIAKKIFDLLSQKNYRVIFSKGDMGVKVSIGKLIVEKKIQNTQRTVEIKDGHLKMNSSVLLDDDVLIQLILEKNPSFQEHLILRMKPSIVAAAIEKSLSKS